MPVDHYENFPVASLLLPAALRAPVEAIYRFARTADDIADEGDLAPDERLRRLDRMRAGLDALAARAATTDPIFLALGEAVDRHDLPLVPFYDLLDAFCQDVAKTRYADFAELMDYCRRSANPVGRLLLRLYRADSPDNLRASDAICSSLQLINFWQDVAVDWRKNRIYLPQEDMRRFGVTEEHVAAGRCDEAWQALMTFQVARARALMRAGSLLGWRLPGRIGLELRLVMAGGLRILDKISAVGGDVFRRRPVLKPWDWPLLLWRAAIPLPVRAGGESPA
ncbi:MAG: squalene synthase HpnC [Pseudomonadota bacterium]|jgi:phytoene synthase